MNVDRIKEIINEAFDSRDAPYYAPEGIDDWSLFAAKKILEEHDKELAVRFGDLRIAKLSLSSKSTEPPPSFGDYTQEEIDELAIEENLTSDEKALLESALKPPARASRCDACKFSCYGIGRCGCSCHKKEEP